MSYSLRELMVVVFIAGLGLVALSAGGWLASALMFLAMVLLIGLAIVAFVGDGSERAYAIGVVIPAICYGVLVWSGGERELDPYESRLPSSYLHKPLFQAMVKITWVNVFSGKEIPKPKTPTALSGGFLGAGVSPGAPRESIDRETFMTTGHLLFALALGYAGAKFAVFIHRRSTPPPPA
ncbi:hypothetical protein [Blastopirellula marina]|uniref:Uncharacterized protein n=1 Tax=Blastopirellula marina DSM 3645 TaxID=314230 RepID=A3ZWQ3_9BACT|nr:hypothetical protein [Blastopirellula marina]EAQ79027.1 hypothetical protein DSM3645_13725 [Blastopirellula marina DSM 3645]